MCSSIKFGKSRKNMARDNKANIPIMQPYINKQETIGMQHMFPSLQYKSSEI